MRSDSSGSSTACAKVSAPTIVATMASASSSDLRRHCIRLAIRFMIARTASVKLCRIASSSAGPMVRIRFPPANSPSLAGFLFPVSKSRQLPRGARARPGGTAGRDAPGSLRSRQLARISLSGAIPVPQCRLGGSRSWVRRAPLIVPSATGDRRRIRHISARSHCLGNKRMLRL